MTPTHRKERPTAASSCHSPMTPTSRPVLQLLSGTWRLGRWRWRRTPYSALGCRSTIRHSLSTCRCLLRKREQLLTLVAMMTVNFILTLCEQRGDCINSSSSNNNSRGVIDCLNQLNLHSRQWRQACYHLRKWQQMSITSKSPGPWRPRIDRSPR